MSTLKPETRLGGSRGCRYLAEEIFIARELLGEPGAVLQFRNGIHARSYRGAEKERAKCGRLQKHGHACAQARTERQHRNTAEMSRSRRSGAEDAVVVLQRRKCSGKFGGRSSREDTTGTCSGGAAAELPGAKCCGVNTEEELLSKVLRGKCCVLRK